MLIKYLYTYMYTKCVVPVGMFLNEIDNGDVQIMTGMRAPFGAAKFVYLAQNDDQWSVGYLVYNTYMKQSGLSSAF